MSRHSLLKKPPRCCGRIFGQRHSTMGFGHKYQGVIYCQYQILGKLPIVHINSAGHGGTHFKHQRGGTQRFFSTCY